MNVYQTDKNGLFTGITTADQDPLDSSNRLIPAGCVEIAPPEHNDMQFVRWNGFEWTIESIPEPEPEPVPEPVDHAQQSRQYRNDLISDSDWTQLADAPLDPVVKASWASYRQDLRNVPQQSGFPNEINWPTLEVSP